VQSQYKPSEKDLQRFWSKVRKSPSPDGCWLWIGTYNSQGYGAIRWNGRYASARRVIWELTYGSEPSGKRVHNHCDNPQCVNPTHLYTDDWERFWLNVDKSGGPDTCWEWQASRLPDGYGSIGRNGRVYRTHRVAWELTYGSIPDGLWVLHHCDNPSCCNPSHLFLGTPTDNMRDCARKGRTVCHRGEEHWKCRLSDVQVAEIRRLYAAGGVSYSVLAKRFGVAKTYIGELVHYEARV